MKGEALAKRLRRLRVMKGVSTRDLARGIGVPESTYREWENGRLIRGEPYLALAKIFEVSLSELLIGEVAEEPKQVLEEFSAIQKKLVDLKQRLIALL